MRVSLRIGVLLPMIVAFVLTFVGLFAWPLWRAELWSWMVATGSFSEMWRHLTEDYHPPGYFGTLWLLFDADTPDWMLRFPSLVGAVGTVGLVAWTARRWFGPAEGFYAGAALALSPFLLVYGGVARGYSLLAFAAAGLLYAGIRMVEGHDARRSALGLFVAGTASVYVHYASASALLATALGLCAALWSRPDRGAGRWVWSAGSLAMVLVAFAPWVLGPMSVQQTDVARLDRSLTVLGYLLWPVAGHAPVANGVLLAFGAVGVGVLLRRRAPADVLVLAWPVLGLVVPLVFSDRSDLQTKYYVQSWFLPAWGLLVGVGVGAALGHVARFRVAAVGFGAALVASAVGPLWALWTLPAAPFETQNGSTVYDVRIEAKLFEKALPAVPVGGFPSEPFSPYGRYLNGVVRTGDVPTWTYRHRIDGHFRSVWTPPEREYCLFAHAFYVVISPQTAVQCAALQQGVEAAAAEHPDYPPFQLELAAWARARGDYATAETLAERAGAPDTGWSDPIVFLTTMHAQKGDTARALEVLEAGIERTSRWQNYFVLKELYSMQKELLVALEQWDRAEAAAWCAYPANAVVECTARGGGGPAAGAE
jgi:hypothetical protein